MRQTADCRDDRECAETYGSDQGTNSAEDHQIRASADLHCLLKARNHRAAPPTVNKATKLNNARGIGFPFNAFPLQGFAP
jgi:hypothetical protein